MDQNGHFACAKHILFGHLRPIVVTGRRGTIHHSPVDMGYFECGKKTAQVKQDVRTLLESHTHANSSTRELENTSVVSLFGGRERRGRQSMAEKLVPLYVYVLCAQIRVKRALAVHLYEHTSSNTHEL